MLRVSLGTAGNRITARGKIYWHSHTHEISSGLLVALGMTGATGVAASVAQAATSNLPGLPTSHGGGGVPETMERGPMLALYKTYGKTIHTWHPLDQDLPLGPPTLMTSSTHAQERAGLMPTGLGEAIEKRDAMYGVNTRGKKEQRKEYLDLEYNVAQGADQCHVDGKPRRFKLVIDDEE